MKILHFIYDDPHNPWSGGGGSARTYDICKRLAKNHSIIVATGNYPGAKNEEKKGVKYIRIGWGVSYLISRLTYMLSAPRWIRKLDYDLLVDDTSPYSPTFAPFYTKKPCVASIRALFSDFSVDLKMKLSPVRKFLCPLLERLNLNLYKIFVCVSDSVKKGLEGNFPKAKRVTVIPNGIDDSLFSVESKNQNYILFLGRMDIAQKGIDLLINVFSKLVKKHNENKLVIAGDGKDLNKVKEFVQEFSLDRYVEFTGRVFGNKKRGLLSRCLFVCMPSRYETWGTVAIEAAACGKAVIGTTIPGLSDAIRDGETGILVKPDDSNELEEAIVRLLKHETLRRNLGENGRYWARNFKWEELIQERENFYLEVARK